MSPLNGKQSNAAYRQKAVLVGAPAAVALLVLLVGGCSSDSRESVSGQTNSSEATNSSPAEICDWTGKALSIEFNAERDRQSASITAEEYADRLEQTAEAVAGIDLGSATPVTQAVKALNTFIESSGTDSYGAPYDYHDPERARLVGEIGEACTEAGSELSIEATSGG